MNVIPCFKKENRNVWRVFTRLTRSVEKPPIVDVTRLKIDHFRWNHHELLLHRMVKLVPQLLAPLMVLTVQPQYLLDPVEIQTDKLRREKKRIDK